MFTDTRSARTAPTGNVVVSFVGEGGGNLAGVNMSLSWAGHRHMPWTLGQERGDQKQYISRGCVHTRNFHPPPQGGDTYTQEKKTKYSCVMVETTDTTIPRWGKKTRWSLYIKKNRIELVRQSPPPQKIFFFPARNRSEIDHNNRSMFSHLSILFRFFFFVLFSFVRTSYVF
jgi:hypothetical protein